MARFVTLTWERFARLTLARARYAERCCIYVQADREGRPVRVGKASLGLVARYRGGTGYALDAAMHGSGNCVFIAAVEPDVCAAVEAVLIYEHRARLRYNNVGKRVAPPERLDLVHEGDVPRFEHGADET
jgi:hypothetical protein